jgi:hypothetical protein
VPRQVGEAIGRVNGPAFLVGWWVGIAIVGAIVLAVAKAPGATDEGEPATWVSWLELILGVLLLLVALKQWRGRPQGDAEPEMPKWMKALDTFKPPKAGTGVVLSALNPEERAPHRRRGNRDRLGRDLRRSAGCRAGRLHPDRLARSRGAHRHLLRARRPRRAAARATENWLAQNNAVIMAVLLVIIGVKLIGDGISGLL